jgi:hypothetical protein
VASRGGGFTPCAAAEAVKPRLLLLLHPQAGAPRAGAAAPPASHALPLKPAPPAPPGDGAHALAACGAKGKRQDPGTLHTCRGSAEATWRARNAARHAPAWRLGRSARAPRLAASGPTRQP